MNHNERIQLTDSIISAASKISEGNPGALSVCIMMIKESAKIDPDCAFAELGPLLTLDSYGIYGPRVWMLYKDVCGHDLVKTLGMLRAAQLGIISEPLLSHAINSNGYGLDVDETLSKVRERLPNFGRVLIGD